MKQFIKMLVLISLLIILVSPNVVAYARIPTDTEAQGHAPGDTCPPVQNTPLFTIVYGSVTLNGVSAPVGSIVKAYSPRNDLVGCFSVTTTGNYGAMYIYGEDTSVVPAIPGMRTNEVVSFTIENIPAASTPVLQWTGDKDLHSINLVSQGVSASFTATPVSGISPLVVQFTDTSSGSVSTWQWNFGDGQSSAIQNPQHTYNSPGLYTVSLTVSGAAGSDTETRTNYISVYTVVNANFVANPVTGIAPLVVSFTNQSSGDYTSSSWSFGDGGTSTLMNPVHTFTTGGTYTVSLTASGLGGTDVETKTNYITVYSPVIANFTASASSGIAPLSVSFTNTSSGDYSSLSWNFGDGATSTVTNPTHTFTAKGSYEVTLTANGPGGLDQFSTVITVYEPVLANFSATPTTGIAPLIVAFTNESTGDFSSLLWDFGDGSTSAELNPSHSYLAGGTYTVTLTASGPGGVDSEIRTGLITVYAPVQAEFSGSPTAGIAPLTVNFSNQSSGDYSTSSWFFGDEGTSYLQNPSHVYTTGGTYSVSLNAAGPGGSDTETKMDFITVYTPVSADFSATPTSGIGPLQVQFTNLSAGSYTSLSWDFGDGTIDTNPNPIHTFTNSGVYSVSLTATGPGGTDVEARTNFIVVYQAVTADFTANVTEGIAPLVVSFTNLSTGDYTNLSWNFGDGDTSTDPNPVHSYANAGTYTVSLTASGNGGTNQVIKTNYITVHSAIMAEFSFLPANGIAPLQVEFTNASTGDFDTLSWDFGDGSPTSNESNPTHIFSTGGVFTVTLTASGVGGEDTQTHTITVYQPVQADFVADSTSGTLPFPVQFQNQSTGDYETVVWDFGDGTPTSTDENPTHIFTKPGIFTVTLTISGLGGTDIETKAGYITGLSHFIFLPIVIR